jgi:hypothetical protein
VEELSFGRPLYLQVLCVLVAILIGAAAAFAVFFRPFDQIILGAGGLILGVYGVRALILGDLPRDVAALDVYLSCVALFLLFTIAIRAVSYMHASTGWKVPRLMTATPDNTRSCPYCITSIDKGASRCPHCTSVIEAEA